MRIPIAYLDGQEVAWLIDGCLVERIFPPQKPAKQESKQKEPE